MKRQDTSVMIAGFLARGGNIQKIPEAVPTTPAEIVEYLKSQRVSVEFAEGKSGDNKFVYEGNVINLQDLVQIANRLRRRRRSPPFEVSLRARH